MTPAPSNDGTNTNEKRKRRKLTGQPQTTAVQSMQKLRYSRLRIARTRMRSCRFGASRNATIFRSDGGPTSARRSHRSTTLFDQESMTLRLADFIGLPCNGIAQEYVLQRPKWVHIFEVYPLFQSGRFGKEGAIRLDATRVQSCCC